MKFICKKRIANGILVASLIFACISILQSSMLIINAENVIKSEDFLETVCAGATEDMDVDVIPSEDEVEQIKNDNSWKKSGALVMANCTNSVNVRTEPSEEADKAGILYNDCGGYIVEYTDEWTKIQSGDLIGWVYNDYLFFGEEADLKADEVGCNRATITDYSVRVRDGASTEAPIIGLVGTSEAFDVVATEGEWLVIDYEGASGYINSNYASIEFILDYGETIEQIEAREQAEKEAAKKAEEKAAADKTAESKQYYEAYATNATDVELLGALIQCEAGNQPYEGQIAVGAVVMNRLRSGAYPNTIYGVIYASGQFTPAGTGAVERRLAKGVSQQCLNAATEAINGYSPVGTAMHFRPTGHHDGIVIGGHVFW